MSQKTIEYLPSIVLFSIIAIVMIVGVLIIRTISKKLK